MYRAKRHGLGSFVFHGEEPHERAQRGTAGARIAAAPVDPLRAGAGRARAPPRAAARGERAAGAGRAQRAGTAGRRGAGAAAADRVPGRGGARAAQPAGADPHGGGTAGPGSRGRDAAAGCRPSSSGRWRTCRAWWATCSTYRASSTGKLRLERQMVDMAGIIDEAVDACRPAMDTRLQHFRRPGALARARSARRPGSSGADPQQPARQRVQVHAGSAARSRFRSWWSTMPS